MRVKWVNVFRVLSTVSSTGWALCKCLLWHFHHHHCHHHDRTRSLVPNMGQSLDLGWSVKMRTEGPCDTHITLPTFLFLEGYPFFSKWCPSCSFSAKMSFLSKRLIIIHFQNVPSGKTRSCLPCQGSQTPLRPVYLFSGWGGPAQRKGLWLRSRNTVPRSREIDPSPCSGLKWLPPKERKEVTMKTEWNSPQISSMFRSITRRNSKSLG